MGTIFAIKKYALHDGPAIRTTVFFNGCPLRCRWCHNPEGLLPEPELLWVKDRCAECGQCLETCRVEALCLEDGCIVRNKTTCTGCHHCVDTCPALAHEATGRELTADQVMAEIKKDILFYDQSGGGVTFSGGDPLFQPQFLLDLLNECGRLAIHRTVDTCALASWGTLSSVAARTDLFLIDIKHMDPVIHKRFTGADNGQILENIGLLAGMKKEIRFRIPLIEGVNADRANISATADFIADTAPGSRVDLLPCHNLAGSKYTKLGMGTDRHGPGTLFASPDRKTIDGCKTQLERVGLKVTMGG